MQRMKNKKKERQVEERKKVETNISYGFFHCSSVCCVKFLNEHEGQKGSKTSIEKRN